MNDRRTFFRKFFPKWSGFSVESIDETRVVEALENLEHLVEDVSHFCTSVSNQGYRHVVDRNKLKLSQVSATKESGDLLRGRSQEQSKYNSIIIFKI